MTAYAVVATTVILIGLWFKAKQRRPQTFTRSNDGLIDSFYISKEK